MYTMYDAVNVKNLPRKATMLAGYVGGYWPTFPLLPKNAIRVSIAINATQTADVLDVEKGDATPQEAPSWIVRMRTKGIVPTVYCAASNRQAVIDACAAAKVAYPFFWIADWTNVAHLAEGSIATQWADGTAQYPGLAFGCDTSLVSPDAPWLAHQRLPKAPVVPAKPRNGSMAPKTLRLFSVGPEVAVWRHRVGLPAADIYTPACVKWTKNFQLTHHLKVDGICGPQTFGVMTKLGLW